MTGCLSALITIADLSSIPAIAEAIRIRTFCAHASNVESTEHVLLWCLARMPSSEALTALLKGGVLIQAQWDRTGFVQEADRPDLVTYIRRQLHPVDPSVEGPWQKILDAFEAERLPPAERDLFSKIKTHF
ncbi:MAG: hypothetical protein QOJ65_415 [Fimbriimonadaceae bacterium]|nr:hypothetical protein [Fimbriimonadaceae bacterium]